MKAMVSFFTIWQQDITEDDMTAMERNFHLAPLAGAIIGIGVMVISLILVFLSSNGILSSSLIIAALVLAAVYVGSRFLHFDGLADFGDGMVVSGTQEDHVRALKDTLVGAGGLGLALVVTILAFAGYSYAAPLLIIPLGAAAEVMVKNSQVAAAAYGRPGNGMAARQVSETREGSVVPALVITIVASLLLGFVGVLLTNAVYGFTVADMTAVIVSVIVGSGVSVLVGYAMAMKSNSVFGMVNGDVLGATNEISRVAVMLAMLLVYALVA